MSLDTDDDNEVEREIYEFEDLLASTNSPEHLSDKRSLRVRLQDYARGERDALVAYAHLMWSVLGGRFIGFLFFSQFVGKGLIFTLARTVMLPLFKSMSSLDAGQVQIYIAMSMIPWSIKPLMGVASDFILIRGYHKRGWLILAWFIGTLSMGLAFLLLRSPWIVICLAGINFQIAMYDLLSEAKYSEVRNEHPELGSNASTMVQAFIIAGSLITTTFVGVLADRGLFWVFFLLTLILSATLIPPTLWGWLPETQLVNAAAAGLFKLVDRDRLRAQWKVIALVCGCAVGSVASSVVASLWSPIAGLIIALLSLTITLIASFRIFSLGVNQVVVFQVVTALSAPRIGTALDYYYTASEECLPDGPHFTFAYYITTVGLTGTIITLLGTFIYQWKLSDFRFRPIFIITAILQGLGGLGDLMIIMRWNVRLGIPDHLAYFVGEAIFEPLVGTFNWIASSALLAIVVEKNLESSCFAFMAGLFNFAQMIAEIGGSIIFTNAGISTAGGSGNTNCNFDSLWWLVILCHITMPTLIQTAAAFIPPNLKQTDSLQAVQAQAAGEGEEIPLE